VFEFKDFDYLTDGEVDLRIEEKLTSNEEKAMYLYINIELLYMI